MNKKQLKLIDEISALNDEVIEYEDIIKTALNKIRRVKTKIKRSQLALESERKDTITIKFKDTHPAFIR
jgi:archaellum component FlaC